MGGKWLKKLMIMILVIVPLIGMTNGGSASARYAVKEWHNWDIRTKTDVTPDKMKAYLKSKGQESFGNKVVDYTYDSATKNGIDPMVLLGMIIVETGYGTSPKASIYNNYGGVRCMSGHECYTTSSGSWTKFSSPEESIRIQAELLAGKLYVKAGLTTIKKMLSRYAPTSDGNRLDGVGGYMYMIGQTIEGIGYKPSDSGKELWTTSGGSANYSDFKESDNGESKESVSDAKVGDYKEFTPFVKPNVAENIQRIEDMDNIVPSETINALSMMSEKVYKASVYIGGIIVAMMTVYISFILVFYLVLVKGISSNEVLYQKMARTKTSVYSREGLKELLIRFILVMLGICFYLSQLYIIVMGYIYKYLNILIENIF